MGVPTIPYQSSHYTDSYMRNCLELIGIPWHPLQTDVSQPYPPYLTELSGSTSIFRDDTLSYVTSISSLQAEKTQLDRLLLSSLSFLGTSSRIPGQRVL